MTEKYAEKISMLVDDELHGHETAKLIEGIEHDEWLKQCWERYHLIGDALKNNLPDMVQHNLAQRVSVALDAEEVHQLTPTRWRKPKPTRTFARPAVGLALAASLAAVAVLVVPWSHRAVSPAGGQPQASLSSPAQESQRLVSDRMPTAPAPERQAAVTTGPEPAVGHEVKIEPVLYDYLLDHNEYTDAASVQSTMLPYVRIVGYTSNANGERH